MELLKLSNFIILLWGRFNFEFIVVNVVIVLEIRCGVMLLWMKLMCVCKLLCSVCIVLGF